jgi:hypothetical protein
MNSKTSFRLILLLLWAGFSLAQRGDAARPPSSALPAFSAGVSQFAIEDFDGDRNPDLAEVQVGRIDSYFIRYSIRVQLTSGNTQSIGVTAPFGKLQIVPRDVNGDKALDLIVSTAYQHEPVAILLNDGHGNFSPVEPTAFPGAFGESTANWDTASNLTIDAVGVPPKPYAGLCIQTRALPYFRQRPDSIPVSGAGFHLSYFLISRAGRALPSEVHHF